MRLPAGVHGKDGKPLPLIVQKSDGGYLYATTDLAADPLPRRQCCTPTASSTSSTPGRRCTSSWSSPSAARPASCREHVSLEHVAFGTMLGADGKPFKTRTGGTVKLIDLLDEAVERAARLLVEREEPRAVRRGARDRRPRGRHRRGQVRRPVAEPHQRLRLLLGQDARPARATPPRTCSTPTPASAASSARPASIRRHSPAPSASRRPRSARWRCAWCSSPRR